MIKVCEIAHWVKGDCHQACDLSLIPRTHMVKTNSPKLPSALHTLSLLSRSRSLNKKKKNINPKTKTNNLALLSCLRPSLTSCILEIFPKL